MRKLVAVPIALTLLLSGAAGAQLAHPAGPAVTLQKFQSPTRLAADESGRLFVADYDQKSVIRVDPADLSIISKFPVGGSVTGLAACGGRLYVGNETLKRIEIYDQAGSFLGLLAGDGGVVSDPADLAVDPGRDLMFAIDGGAKAVKMFSILGDGVLLGTISGPGTADELLQHPTGLAVDPAAQEVFVSDYGDIENDVQPRVAIFGYDGSYRGSVSGSGGTQGYYFSKPQGVAVGESGHVFVADAWLGRVAVMDRATGAQLSTLGEYGPRAGQLRLPLDILILGPTRDLYVTSNLTRRVEIFAEGGKR